MKAKIIIVTLFIIGSFNITATAQKVYPVTSGEMIFSQGSASFKQDFLNQYPGAKLVANNMRYTVFFHLGQYFHMDFNNVIGLYSGIAVRNVGMITDETLPQTVSTDGGSVPYADYNIVRRQYMIGVPLALKLGSFSKHLYIFGGGEYEMAFHFKEKYWTKTFDRSGSKTKDSQWFSSQTPTFLPSVFAGIHFPGGFNVNFKYYLTDFLNPDYKLSINSQPGSAFNLSDLSRYKSSQMVYVSLCWQFSTSSLWKWDHD